MYIISGYDLIRYKNEQTILVSNFYLQLSFYLINYLYKYNKFGINMCIIKYKINVYNL